jgi:hypothetical protein
MAPAVDSLLPFTGPVCVLLSSWDIMIMRISPMNSSCTQASFLPNCRVFTKQALPLVSTFEKKI